MTNFDFRKWNKILGWLVFAIALITYMCTVEPTASFWDAGEYISTSSKLQVGHPPGAPLFQMMGAFFSTFASDADQVALMVNLVSAFSSAFTILFMFWSITLLVRKIAGPEETLSTSSKIAVLGSALVGSLAFAFTDSFWFSAVEAEVYAMASFLMAVLFYAGLLWERDMFKPRGNRWLILISFIIGLSFGVHFMALLTIPAIGFLYFFKNTEKVTVKNFIIANIIVVAILMFIFKLLLPYSLSFFAVAEVFFVNSIGLPFNSGTIIAALALIALFYFGLNYTRKKNYIHANTLLLCVLFIFVGFSSWIMLPIRANAGTTINENSPNNARELLAYYNREQYPETKLFYGPQFTDIYGGLDPDEPYIDDKPKYEEDEKTGKYVIVNEWKNAKQNSSAEHKTFLPRMWSTDHVANYMRFTGPINFTILPEYQSEQQLVQTVNEFRRAYNMGKISNDDYASFLQQFAPYIKVEKPSASSNFRYLFEYQIGYMYWRYFMWNFVGRQDDQQGQYGRLHGNWLSGIDFIDEWHIGSQDNLPSDVENNKARNTYYFLPLILGLIGFFFHLNKDNKSFWVLLVFFLFTGIALKIYLNERPFEPRERDYALVGSFYVFAIWIGFGVYALFDSLKKYVTPKILAPAITIVCLLAVPGILVANNWDDHDRSGKYTATSMAKMYLDSVDENGILFTIGDNDTFALWYAQEIEGYRTDVRVINTSLFATDWYIDQMKRAAYKSKAVKTTLEHSDYSYGTNDYVRYYKDPRVRDTMLIENWIKYIKSENPSTKAEMQNGQMINTFPTKHIRLPVNATNAIESGIVKAKDRDKIVPYIDINIKSNAIYKNRLLMFDVVANTDWKRPIYFTGGSFNDSDYLWMKDYLQLEGVCYKLVPIKTPIDPKTPYDMGRIDTDKMYDIVMNWEWGNSGSDDIYHDPETRKNSITYRGNLARLVENLLAEKDTLKAKKVLDLGMEKMPVDKFGYYTLLEPFIQGYYEIGETEKARELWQKVAEKYQEKLTYFSQLPLQDQYQLGDEIITNIERYRSLVDILILQQDEKLMRTKAEEFNNYLKKFKHFYDENEGFEEDSEPTENSEIDGLENELMQPRTLDVDTTSQLKPNS
ncbi:MULTISPECIES: glycosyltransferase family 117 protein [Mesonia]|uniref:Uncharacterized protein n=1 Tax=Mesonia oceanica TaxID=2687242 RepID=A0AC61Y8G9_9FLAO|nr:MULTISPECIES: DUF2723 domain-containing protein [Mesonia]MAN27675.1 hypothetical protein [Mesonia sp.]MAQ40280.1 hypothetical protein [Mesonia sp.]MBJ97190.1 hypothetical protein [Flavobacteriaceae bacterium]VVV00711.1 hypothetical protein FVB9532_01985 [Mesonia oceanica]|tara:strand:- start:25229 stop:28552 length:3324 start_codon:yes stop_codon:yes gene_type:complete